MSHCLWYLFLPLLLFGGGWVDAAGEDSNGILGGGQGARPADTRRRMYARLTSPRFVEKQDINENVQSETKHDPVQAETLKSETAEPRPSSDESRARLDRSSGPDDVGALLNDSTAKLLRMKDVVESKPGFEDRNPGVEVTLEQPSKSEEKGGNYLVKDQDFKLNSESDQKKDQYAEKKSIYFVEPDSVKPDYDAPDLVAEPVAEVDGSLVVDKAAAEPEQVEKSGEENKRVASTPLRITIREYERHVLPRSQTRPFLFFAYRDFCEECEAADLVWEQFLTELSDMGVETGALNVALDQVMARKLRVGSVPSVVGVVAGRLAWYSAQPFGRDGLRQFLCDLFPFDLLTEIDDDNVDEFLGGWRDNRVRALLVGAGAAAIRRYTATAFEYRDRVLAGYVNLSRPGSEGLRRTFGIDKNQTTLLMFNENVDSPVARISAPILSHAAMTSLFGAHDFLTLPRLSSQSRLDRFCPPDSPINRKKLCVVLLTRRDPPFAHDAHRQSFRTYAAEHQTMASVGEGKGAVTQRVRYAYVYEEAQTGLVSALTFNQGSVNDSTGALQVAIMWRRTPKSIQFDLLPDGWLPVIPPGSSPSQGGSALARSDPASSSRPHQSEALRRSRQLTRLVDWAAQSSDSLTYVVTMRGNLTDEHARSLWVRMLLRLGHWVDRIWDRLLSIDRDTLTTVSTTVGVVVLVGFIMRALAAYEEAQISAAPTELSSKGGSRVKPAARVTPAGGVGSDGRPTVRMHPLEPATFKQLVLDSEPGVRLIVILADEGSRCKLLQDFARIIYPYSRSKAFQFGFLQLEQGLSWYQRLLQDSLSGVAAATAVSTAGSDSISVRAGARDGETPVAGAEAAIESKRRDLSRINARNCLGTVLAINGPRKYYYIYHLSTVGAGHAGGEESDEGEEGHGGDARKVFEGDLLRGLQRWMDRLCGTGDGAKLKKFRVEAWPDMAAPDGGDTAVPDGCDVAAPDGSDMAAQYKNDVAMPDQGDMAAPYKSNMAMPDHGDMAVLDEVDMAVPYESDMTVLD